jgi:hypothetical protein
MHEGHLIISWTHLITLSWNFVEVQWWSPFQSTSLGKQCTSYNAPPTSRKHVPDHWPLRNFLLQSSHFMVGKAQKSHEMKSGLNGECFNGVSPIHFFQVKHRIQFRSRPMWCLGFSNHEKRLSLHLHKVPTWSDKVSLWTLQMALITTYAN